jgi:hypothetical protein
VARTTALLFVERISKSVPVELMVDLDPKTEPTMTATISTTVSKLVGMMNFFFRYQ